MKKYDAPGGLRVVAPPASDGQQPMIAPHKLWRSATNREVVKDEEYAELMASIKEHGILQPLVVRPVKAGEWFVEPGKRSGTQGFFVMSRGYVARMREMERHTGREPLPPHPLWSQFLPPFFTDETEAKEHLPIYEIVIGEHRWTAAMELGLKEVPFVLRELNDREAVIAQLVENLRRKGLRPLDEANGYQRMKDMGMSIEEIGAEMGGVKKTVIYARLSLLNLPAETIAAVQAGKIPASTAELITRLETPEKREAVTQKILHPHRNDEAEGGVLSVRAARELVEEEREDEKERKAWATEMEKHRGKEGVSVLDFEASAKLLPWRSSPGQGYVSADRCCYQDAKRRNFGSLLNKSKLPVTIVRDPEDGHAVKLWFEKDAATWLRETYKIDIGKGAAPVNSDAEKAKARTKRETAKVNRQIFPAVLGEMAVVGGRLGLTVELARYLAHEAIDSLSQAKATWIVKRRDWEETNKNLWPPLKVLHAHADDLSAKDALGLFIECKAARYEPFDFGTSAYDRGMEKLAAAVKVEPKKIEQRFRASGKEES